MPCFAVTVPVCKVACGTWARIFTVSTVKLPCMYVRLRWEVENNIGAVASGCISTVDAVACTSAATVSVPARVCKAERVCRRAKAPAYCPARHASRPSRCHHWGLQMARAKQSGEALAKGGDVGGLPGDGVPLQASLGHRWVDHLDFGFRAIITLEG